MLCNVLCWNLLCYCIVELLDALSCVVLKFVMLSYSWAAWCPVMCCDEAEMSREVSEVMRWLMSYFWWHRSVTNCDLHDVTWCYSVIIATSSIIFDLIKISIERRGILPNNINGILILFDNIWWCNLSESKHITTCYHVQHF